MPGLIPDDAIARLRVDGFFLLRLPEASSSALAAAIDAAFAFFRMSNTQKLGNSLPEGCGYRPMGTEYSASPDLLDLMESFTANVRTQADAAALPSPIGRLLHERAITVTQVLEPIAEAFATKLARVSSGDQNLGDFKGAFHRRSFVQFNYAQPSVATAEFINEAHEDGTLMTIGCATARGLEIRSRAGDFVPLTVALPDVIVMPAEIAALLSGGYVQPLYHRVRQHPDCPERLALLFNGDIEPRLCTAWVRNELNANVDIGARVLTNSHRFGIPGFCPE